VALQVDNIKRVFKIKIDKEKLDLADPGPHMSPEDVMNFYSNQYTSLTTATVSGPEMKDGAAVYKFESTVGTKG